jgi:photosystem II stability/assembly factor-like uncharacterized protein
LPGGWTNISGATSGQYTTGPISDSDNGSEYRVIITPTDAAALTSSAATLFVETAPVAPSITVQPEDVAVVADQNAFFSVTATGTSLTYQWQRSIDGANWVDISGGGVTLQMTDLTTDDDGALVRVIVSNMIGSVTSTSVHLAVRPTPTAPVFTTSPNSLAVVAGQAASFNAQAVGTPVPEIGWQTSTDGATWTAISGAAAGTYTLPAASLLDNGRWFRAVASNASGSVNSGMALLTVTPAPAAPVFTLSPVSATAAIGGSVTFSASASGQPTPSYQWQISTDGGASFTNINGATAQSYSVGSAASSLDGSRYRAVASNASGNATSSAASLTVMAPPAITLQPASAAWRPGAVPAFFLGGASGTGVTFQWQVSRDQGGHWTNVDGATSASFVYPAAADASVNSVRFLASNAAGLVSSQAVPLAPHHWTPVTATITSTHLRAVCWTGPATVVAVGDLGTVVRSTDGGATWSVAAETRSSNILAMASSGTTVIAVGHNGAVLRSPDSGAHWVRLFTAMPGVPVRGVAFSGDSAIAVGDGGLIQRSTDGGTTWQSVSSDAGTLNLVGVAFNGSGVGLAVGDSGKVLRTVDAGSSWATVRSGNEFLKDVAFVNAGTAVAIGDGGKVLRSTDAGLSWQAINTGSSLSLVHVAFDAAGNGIATGGSTSGSTVRLRTNDGGQTWSAIAGPAEVDASAFSPAGDVLVAVGRGGEIESSRDGGSNWTRRTPTAQRGLYGIAFVSTSVGIAVGDAGTILRTVDGGNNWAPASAPASSSRMSGVAFATSEVGVAVGQGGKIWRTTDAGASWSAVNSNSSAWLRSVAFSSTTTGAAVGEDGIVWTIDAGATWHPASPANPGVQSVAFASPLVGVAVGSGYLPMGGAVQPVVLRTTDGGQTWQPQTSGINSGLHAVAFSEASTALAVGTFVQIRSTDAGQTWVRLQPAVYTWSDLHFNSPTEAVGLLENGFFFVSHDGGLTWPEGSYVVGDETTRLAVSPAGTNFITTAGGAIYRDHAP